MKIRLFLVGLGLVSAAAAGCHEPREGRNAGRVPPSLDPSTPPIVPPAPPTVQTAPTLDDLEGALAAAVATCFVGDAFERRCGAWSQLRDNVRARAADTGWHGRLRGLLDAESKRSRLALELLTEGALTLPPEAFEGVRTRLWRVVDDAERQAEIRALAVRALGAVLDEPGLERLLQRVTDPAPEVRAAVTYLLGEPHPALVAGRPKVIAALLAVLQSDAEGDEVRGAIRSLGALRVEAAAAGLVARLDDPLVGANATLALAGLRDPRAFSELLKRLEAGGEKGEVAPAVIAALGTLASHPKFDRARVEAALLRIEKALSGSGATRADATVVRDLAQRARLSLSESPGAPAATPATAGAGRPPRRPR